MKYLHIHFNIYDNPSLSKDIIETYENSFQGVFYSRFILGKWVIGDGVVYDNFNKNTMVFKAETVAQARYDKTYIAVDYGTANATVFKKWRKSLSNIVEEDGYNQKQIRVGDWVCTDEYYYSGKDNKGKQKTDAEYVKDLRNFCRYECAVWDSNGEFSHYDWSRVVVILDPSALSFRTALRKRGFKVRRAKNSVINGIRTMAGLLNNGTMKYSDVCEETFKEFGSYVWDAKQGEKGEDVPVKQFDHCLTGDTLVDTTEGQVPIKDLVGTTGSIYALAGNGKPVITGYEDVRMTQAMADIYEIELEDGRVLRLTKEHPVMTNNGWRSVGELNGNERVACIEYMKVRQVPIESIRKAGQEPVYNLEVPVFHNFTVNGGLVVHNCMDADRYFAYTILRGRLGMEVWK